MNVRELHAALQAEIDAGRGEEPVFIQRVYGDRDILCVGTPEGDGARWGIGCGALSRVGV